jgi:hypothetical protein
VVIQLILGLDHVEFRALPFPTKIVVSTAIFFFLTVL